MKGGLTGQIIIVLFAFTMFSFLPNENTLLSNFWQWIPYTCQLFTVVYNSPNLLTQHGLVQRRLVMLLNYYRTHIPDDVSTY